MKPDIKKISVQGIAAYFKEKNSIFLSLYLFWVVIAHIFTVRTGGLSMFSFGLMCAVLFLFLMCISPFLLRKTRTLKMEIKERELAGGEKILCFLFFFAAAFGILFGWYLAYYPGAFSTDTIYQYKQALSGQYNDWKPILQTLITFTLPWKLTGRADAIVLFQIIEYSCILAYTAFVIWKYTGLYAALPALFYVLLNPVTGNIVICPWKDVTFAMLALLLMTFGLQIHITDGKWLSSKKNLLFLVPVLVAATIVRHNAFLFSVPYLAAVMVRTGTKGRIRILIPFLIGLGLIKGCLNPALSVEEEWYPKTRILGVPMTILGNVVQEAPECLDEETLSFLYDVAPKDIWEGVYRSGSFNSIKWDANQAVIDEAGIRKVNGMALRALLRAPGPAWKGFCGLTDLVYGLGDILDWSIGPYMAENDVGLEFRGTDGTERLEEYTERSRNSIFKYLFWYVGVINLLIIIAALGKCRFTQQEERLKLLFALPILIYNLGTMLLLSDNEFKYFYLNYPLFPLILVILFGEKPRQDEGMLLVPKKAVGPFVQNAKGIYKVITGIIRELDLPGRIKNAIRILKRACASVFSRKALPNWLYGIFALLFACSIVLGKQININEKPYFIPLDAGEFLRILFGSIAIGVLGNILLKAIGCHLFELQETAIGKRWWARGFLLLVLLWGPYLLAYYPGILTPDSFTSLIQAKNISLLYNHIPVAYTLMVTLFTRIGWAVGDANFGVFLFSIAQLSIMAGVLSYLAYWLRRKVRNAVISWTVLLFYGLNPAVAFYSITMWKDVLFSAWIVLLGIFLCDIALKGGETLGTPKELGRLCLLFVLVSFGRNNGIYVIILCWVTILIFWPKVRRKVLVVGGGTILAIVLIQGPGYRKLEIDQAGFAESVGIPLQQICYTVVQGGTLDEEDREFLENIIPISVIRESYSPISVDSIKFNAKFNTVFFEQNKTGFIKLYLKLLPSHLKAYMQSYLLSTSGFWKIQDINWLVAEDITENDMGIHNVDYLDRIFHLDLKKDMSGRITTLRQSFFTNVGLMVWMTFFFVIAGFRQRQYWKACLALPLIACWLTIMIATPVASQFRYVYYYHLMLPVIIILIFSKGKD